MEYVIVKCLEGRPKGFLLLFGTRKGETVVFVRLEDSGDVVCVNPEALRFVEVIATVSP